MEYIKSSSTEADMGFLMINGFTVLDLTLDDKVLGYKLPFWRKLFDSITDDMYDDPLHKKCIKKFYTNLVNTDFVVKINDINSLHRVGNKVYWFIYTSVI